MSDLPLLRRGPPGRLGTGFRAPSVDQGDMIWSWTFALPFILALSLAAWSVVIGFARLLLG